MFLLAAGSLDLAAGSGDLPLIVAGLAVGVVLLATVVLDVLWRHRPADEAAP
jgi:ABC-type nitrate/sulfonate/bicarbonate transport system substrate-binding protein